MILLIDKPLLSDTYTSSHQTSGLFLSYVCNMGKSFEMVRSSKMVKSDNMERASFSLLR